MRKLKSVLVIASVLGLSACGTKEAPGPLEPTAATGRIRFVNLIADPVRVPVDPILEGLPFGAGVGYGGAVPALQPAPATANYSPIYTGARSLVLKQTSSPSVIVASFPLTITVSQDITVYATGGVAGATVTAVTTVDDNTAAAATQVRLRAANMSSVGAVDVFVTAPNADLSTATPTFPNVGVKTASAYAPLATGTYQIRAVPAGTAPAARAAAVSFNMTDVALTTGGTVRTILIADKSSGGAPLVGFLLADR